MSKIEWTDETWNPVRGCRHVSPGCLNCYAALMTSRLEAMGQEGYAGLTRPSPDGKRRLFTGEFRAVPDALDKPLHWKKPRMIFVNSMSDLFGEGIPFEFIAAVFGVMAACPQHTFQVLTKRADRLLEFFEWLRRDNADMLKALANMLNISEYSGAFPDLWDLHGPQLGSVWPLPNVWLGVSAENQASFDARVPKLLQTPASVRFLSLEPLLERLELSERIAFFNVNDWSPAPSEIHWVIVGGESGPNARECRVEWIADIVEQCKAAGVPCFVKQLGFNATLRGDPLKLSGKGGNRAEWPAACQEWPREWPRKVV